MKRINHLRHQYAEIWSNRWCKAQKRLPHKRIFIIFFKIHKCEDNWLFSNFFGKSERMVKSWDKKFQNYTLMKEEYMNTTTLYRDFVDDYYNARKPVKTKEEVKPLKLSEEQIDKLLYSIENWSNSFINTK